MQTLFLCSIFIQVEAEIWKTAQNSIITWFNWRNQFHTTVLLSSAVYTMSLKWAVVPRLSIQYPGNCGLHRTISPSVPVFPVRQVTFIYNPRLSTRLKHNGKKIRSIAAIKTDVNKPHISFKVKSNYYWTTCLFLNVHNKDASLCERKLLFMS